MAIPESELKEIKNYMEKGENPLIFFDDDHDGLASYILFKKAFEKFHNLRNRWKEVGPVPGQHATELWNNYKFFSDKFYEFVEINKELFDDLSIEV